MSEDEEILELTKQVLFHARQVKAEVEKDLADIENPKIITSISKKKAVRRLRMINGLIMTGEKVQEDLIRKSAKKSNQLVKRRK